MRITPPQTKPPVPQISPGQTSIKVPYIGPAEKEELIGRIPEDHYVSTDTFSYSSQLIANPAKAVYANQPQMDSAGKTVFEKKTKEVDLTPYSPAKYGLRGAVTGAAVGGFLGIMVAGVVGVSAAPVAVPAALALGFFGKVIGAESVRGDKVTLDFRKQDVTVKELAGFDVRAEESTTTSYSGKAGRTETVDGHHLYFSPKIHGKKTGETYWEPYARHSSDENTASSAGELVTALA